MHYAVHGDSGTDKQRISGVQRILSDDKWFVKFYQSIRDSINDLYDSFFYKIVSKFTRILSMFYMILSKVFNALSLFSNRKKILLAALPYIYRA